MNTTHLRRLDFTLLLIFQAVMKHRKLTVAADELGLTQSALSHALKRLRDVVGEELFERRQFGVEPTEAAYALIGPVETILQTADEALAPKGPFDPATDDRIFRIIASDLETALVAPLLLETLTASAPHLNIVFEAGDREEALRRLADGAADIALGGFFGLTASYEATPILISGYQVLARRHHSVLKKKLSLKKYLGCNHILVTGKRDLFGIVDRALAESGHQRRVVASVPYFLAALATVAATDAIVTVPAPLATRYAQSFDLRAYPPPVDIRPVTISAVTHTRRAADDAVAWLQDQIAAAGQTLATSA